MEGRRAVVLYGSESGTAAELAARVWRACGARGLGGPLRAADEYPVRRLPRERLLLLVAATTGRGEAPANMCAFWRFLLRRALPPDSLRGLRFAVLALGDSSYPHFNFVGKKLHRRLVQLGAEPLLDVGLCDYQHDLGHDAVMIPWLEQLWLKLKEYYPDLNMDPNVDNRFIPRWKVSLLKTPDKFQMNGNKQDIYFRKDWEQTFLEQKELELIQNTRTTSEDHFQDVRLLSFKMANDTPFNYKPGDVFNVRPRNSQASIDDLFEIFRSHNLDIEPHYRLIVEEIQEAGSMLRRQARLRREYLYRKSAEEKARGAAARKAQLARALHDNVPIHGDLRRDALQIQKQLDFDDKGPERAAVIGGVSGGANTLSSQDDEYRYAGVEDPKIMITTSREPSARLKMFVKELRLIFPNSQRMNRGGYEMSQLIHACRANDVTDFIVVHEHRGVPDSLVICHLPYGPTASFTLSGVIMRHDIPDIGPMTEQYPHLIFHNFKTDLGMRTMSILKYLFPVPKEDSKRVITFANHDDYVSFRQHTYKKVEKNIELSEIGPRFQMKLYSIKLGTMDTLDTADTEWALRPYMNTAAKRRFLSVEDGWVQEDDI